MGDTKPLGSLRIRTFLRSKRAVQTDIREAIQRLRDQARVGLHLGCGTDLIPGLINCDPHDPAADRKASATDLSEFEDGLVDHVESHHMLEHLSFQEAEQALNEMARVLHLGGHLILTCPDLTRIAQKWLRQSGAVRFGQTIQMIYGSQEHPGMFHKSGYDAWRLRAMLEQRGFEILVCYSPYPARPTPSLLVIARRSK